MDLMMKEEQDPATERIKNLIDFVIDKTLVSESKD